MTSPEVFWWLLAFVIIVAILSSWDWWRSMKRDRQIRQNTFEQRRAQQIAALHQAPKFQSEGPHGFAAQNERRAHAQTLRRRSQ